MTDGDRQTFDDGVSDVCVVGGGPVGIALALACAKQGLSVRLIESGFDSPHPTTQALSEGHRVDPERHAPPSVAICRALGGASRWWGGRCVPFDRIDFEPRAHVPEAEWPLAYEDVARWHAAAAAFLGVRTDRFTVPTDQETAETIDECCLERWAPEIDMAARHRESLGRSPTLRVERGVTVTNLELSAGKDRVIGLEIAGSGGRHIPVRIVVLACGGLETTRLLLAVQRRHPRAFGGPAGALGRYYMGHLSGRIADIVLSDPAMAAEHDFIPDDGVFVRRRMTLRAPVQIGERLLNTSFWIDNPPFHAPAHGSGVLSLVWLALAWPAIGRRLVSEAVRLSHVGAPRGAILPHLRNVLRSPLATAREALSIAAARLLARPPKPGFVVKSHDGRYALHYHAEQSPDRRSTVTLSDRGDASGLPYLDIDLRYGAKDARSVVRGHAILDEALRRSGRGRLEYFVPEDQCADSVLAQARDGFHQIGTARMGVDPRRSVVDPNCRAHGFDNLFVASSAVFPSSGQANPTFQAVALALRLANHLASTSHPAAPAEAGLEHAD